MKREKTIYEGPMVLGIIILVTAHFMGLCLNGLCSDDWLIRNLILGTAVEFFMFIYLHKQINEGAKTLYRETRNLGLIVNYYQKIRGYAFIGFFYVITFCMFPNTRKERSNHLINLKGPRRTLTVLLISFPTWKDRYHL